jgi:hypothetical protein
MSDLQPLVDKLFEECRQMCQKLTKTATIEETIEYERKLMELCDVWMNHNDRTVELLNKAIWKCDSNKKILMNQKNSS